MCFKSVFKLPRVAGVQKTVLPYHSRLHILLPLPQQEKYSEPRETFDAGYQAIEAMLIRNQVLYAAPLFCSSDKPALDFLHMTVNKKDIFRQLHIHHNQPEDP